MIKQTIASLFKRVKALEENEQRPWTMTFVYTDGHRETMEYDIKKFLDVVTQGTAKTGVVDVIPEFQTEGYDNFYDVFKVDGIYPDLTDLKDDSDMILQEDD